MNDTKKTASCLISIIVPAYNDEEYISCCLDSLIHQSLKEIEIIVVDDCSSDATPDIIRKYVEADSRIKAFFLPENRSSFVARKVGVLHSSGKYIMFSDADDYLDTSACEILYHKIEAANVDILHFGTEIVPEGKRAETNLLQFKQQLNTEAKTLYGKDVFEDLVYHTYGGHQWNLWNKIFRQQLCKDALKDTEDLVLPRAQDKYLYWILAFHASSYECIPELILYYYRYGAGLFGNQQQLTLQMFERYCTQAWTQNAIEAFMKDKNPEGRYDKALENSRAGLINHCIRNWSRLEDQDKAGGLDMILRYWDHDLDRARIVNGIAMQYWKDNPDKLLKLISGAEALKLKQKEIKTIGTCYLRYDNGGIQRVLSILMRTWLKMGYRVVLFTDFDEAPDDYELPEGVIRVKLAYPASLSNNADLYRPRCISLAQYILDYQIDCMVYHQYFAQTLLWDTLVCKLYNVPFFLFYHNTFTRFLIYNDERFATIAQTAPLFDGMIVLGREEEVFWKNFARNAMYIPNPLTFQLPEKRRLSGKSRQILWLGRMDNNHKQPYDAITMMQELLKLVPDAELLMVGDNNDPDYLPEMQAHIDELGLSDHIRLCGFQQDVESYFRQASVFIMTSAHEGFPMALGEAMSFGLPVVMYDLPYLELVKGNQGVVSVDQRDCQGMAREVAKLLQNEAYHHERAKASSDFIYAMYENLDYGSYWSRLFQGVQYDDSSFVYEDKTNLFRLIVNAYALGMKYQATREAEFRKKLPPINLSARLSADAIMKGEQVTVDFSADGGVGNKQYEVRYKQSAKKKWTVAQEYSDNMSVCIRPSWNGSYDVRVKAKDVLGTTELFDLTFFVRDVLKNTSAFSTPTLTKGESLTIRASATGGTGSYSYAVMLQRPTNAKWIVFSPFSDQDTITITPRNVGDYRICVKVKDETGTISKKYFSLTVR